MSMKFQMLLRLCIMILLGLPLITTPQQTVHAASDEHQVATRFREYYATHQGIRVLGMPLSGLQELDGRAAQYFEKGRLEDHRAEVPNPTWAFMYGRLTAELLASDAHQQHPVNATTITYRELRQRNEPMDRHAPPTGFTTGTQTLAEGVFVPYDPQLRAAPGYIVPVYFWRYMNRKALVPGGWLHDLGLPMTDAFVVDTVKRGTPRPVMMQAFERAILTYDPLNPPAWQVERGNIGADAWPVIAADSDIILPATNATITLPLHLMARVGQPGEHIDVTLRWKNGVTLGRSVTTLRGEDGRGLVITNIDWQTERRPPQPAARGALLQLHDQKGTLLAQQPLQVLRWDDPAVQHVTVYWLAGNALQPAQRNIPRTVRTGTAALEELLWGPRPGNLAGFRSALPSPQEVLSYAGREADWGARVTLRRLVIRDGRATADFSRELWAYGGDVVRGQQIRAQITQTLLQFSSVDEVEILIEGQSKNVLQP